jgi:hypothetical protein
MILKFSRRPFAAGGWPEKRFRSTELSPRAPAANWGVT